MSDGNKGLLDIIKGRRSVRGYKPEPPPGDVLERVIEAGQFAPSGSNSQSTRFIVITSQDKLTELRGAITGVLANMPIKEGMPPPLVGLIKQAQTGPVDVNYGAPALIITANKKGYVNALPDCACALMSMMLMASEEGLGSCWINQYRLMGEAPPLRALLREAGLQDDEEVCGALALGYAAKPAGEPLERSGNPVVYIR